MPGPVLNRPQTCLSCLRNLPNVVVGSASASPRSVSLVQSRGKKSGRLHDQGVFVRLLEDIPRWGRKDAVLRVERGRMRNLWYPQKKAEFMTATRFKDLGMTRADISDRDHLLGTFAATPEPAEARPLLGDEASAVKVKHPTAKRSHALLDTLIPKTITFYRKPIHPSPPTLGTNTAKATPARSPLIAHQDILSEAKGAGPKYDPSIYGSVSIDMIVADIKARLIDDAEASRVALEPRHITLLGLEPGADRLKALGRWKIEISLVASGDKPDAQPVRKTVEILPEEEDSSPGHTEDMAEHM